MQQITITLQKKNWRLITCFYYENCQKSTSLAIIYHIFCLAITQLLDGSVRFLSWGERKRPTIREGIYLVSLSKSLISRCLFHED